ncbi:MAG TPA: 1-(5-phosphoribosyl)-5-[(5-phosphoribosylamino)methylideneamino]imidazole-4-carboxamide isomerase [Candidatus Latescibacteria bacterium]|nr:1-(5-phosphoribosyl)-5-[(5-phosphoribosylamino)methylideneamino]imidazole-4-carboxamide isomerase [Candidatus Latescibacterota bacterium]
MEVIPAIDIRGGKCVRLYQGDYDRETVFSEDPAAVASRWAELGAGRLHVVDLDGARDGVSANLSVVGEIASAVSVPVQLGGGIRTIEAARAAMSAGVDRVIIGTAAVENPDLAARLIEALSVDAVVVSVDARDGYVAIKGWTEGSRTRASTVVEQMEHKGVRRFMYTDIARDGTLEGPNLPAIEELMNGTESRLMAAGGISSVEQLLSLAGLKIEAAIVGKAVYTGDIDLGEALEAVAQRSESLK